MPATVPPLTSVSEPERPGAGGVVPTFSVPAETVRILLGHSSIKATQAYLHLTEVTRQRIRNTVGGFSVRLFD